MINCICLEKPENNIQDLIECSICNNYQHKQCVFDCINSINHDYICPQCQIYNSEIYINQIKNILPAKKFNQTVLKNSNNIKHEYTFSFKINLYEYHPTEKHRKGFIIIRCLKLGKKYFNLKWPEKVKIIINKKTFNLNNPRNPLLFKLRSITKNDFANRNYYYNIYNISFHDDSIFIDKNINDITIKIIERDISEGKQFFSYNYALSIDYVEMLNEDEVLKLIPHKSDKNEILKIINNGNVNSENVDLFHPVDYIEIPARGMFCNHFKVFDLKHFLSFWNVHKKYYCIFCKKPINYLYIDDIFKNILNEFYNKNIETIKIDCNYNIIDTIKKIDNNIESEIDENEDDGGYLDCMNELLNKESNNLNEEYNNNESEESVQDIKSENQFELKEENDFETLTYFNTNFDSYNVNNIFEYNNHNYNKINHHNINNKNNNEEEDIEIITINSSNSFTDLETYSNETEEKNNINYNYSEDDKGNRSSNTETNLISGSENNIIEKNSSDSNSKSFQNIFPIQKNEPRKKYITHKYEINQEQIDIQFSKIIKELDFKSELVNKFFDFNK
jgi:hypothetical protein